FADYVAPHRRVLSRVPLVRPAVPLWSATTAAPYPSDPDAIHALAMDHLVRPVRFRELTLALHEDGVRIFVQVGTGSLTNFVSDTLRGRPHLCISANVPARSGLSQLQRVAAALFVEGAHGVVSLQSSVDSPTRCRTVDSRRKTDNSHGVVLALG